MICLNIMLMYCNDSKALPPLPHEPHLQPERPGDLLQRLQGRVSPVLLDFHQNPRVDLQHPLSVLHLGQSHDLPHPARGLAERDSPRFKVGIERFLLLPYLFRRPFFRRSSHDYPFTAASRRSAAISAQRRATPSITLSSTPHSRMVSGRFSTASACPAWKARVSSGSM